MADVIVLGQSADAPAGLAEWLRRRWPGARRDGCDARTRTARREYAFTDPADRDTAHFYLLVHPPADVAVIVVPVETGVEPGTADLAAVARLRGVGHFVLFVVGTSDEPAWRDLVEADAREALAAVGIPADDLPVADTLTRLFAVLDALEFVPREPARDGPVRLTVRWVQQRRTHAGLWDIVARVERGICRVGDELQAVGPGASGWVAIAEMGGAVTPVVEARAGESLPLHVATEADARPEVGQTLVTPGTLTAIVRFNALIRLRERGGRRGPIYPGYATILTRDDESLASPTRHTARPAFSVRLTDFREPTGEPALLCMPGGVVWAACELLVPLPLEPGDRFVLHEPVADGVVLAVEGV